MSIHPLSQAEADRVFSPEDRAQAAKPYKRQISNMKQRAYRTSLKASAALDAWFTRLGTVEDVLDYEREAEAQQILVGRIAGMEATLKRITGE